MHEITVDFGIIMSVLNFTMQNCLKLGTNLKHAVPMSSVLHSEAAIKETGFLFSVYSGADFPSSWSSKPNFVFQILF